MALYRSSSLEALTTAAKRPAFISLLAALPLAAAAVQVVLGHVDLAPFVIAELLVAVLFFVSIRDLVARAATQDSEVSRATHQLRVQADILASVRESVIATDLAGQVTYWGPGAAAIFGYTAEDMLGRTLDVIYPIPVEGAADDLARILAGVDYEGEWQGRHRDGSTIWLQVHTSVMRDQSDQPVGFIGVASDTTQRRRWQAQLTRLGAVVEQSSESVMITNTNAEIEYVNPAFERVSGWSREEVIGKNPRILQSGDHPPAFYRAMWATLTAGKPWLADLSNRRKDGTPLMEEAVVFPIRDESGGIDGYVSVKRDVTEQRRVDASGAVQLRERALIAETMRAISGRETPEEIAVAICVQVSSLADVASAGLFIFELDGRATQYGFATAGRPSPPLSRVPRRRSAYLLERASRGPWIERWDDRPWHPYNEVFMAQGVQAVAYAPVRDGANVIGFLHIASAAPNAEEHLVDRLPALAQFADIASSMIGPKVAARTEVAAVRESIELVIRDCAFEAVFQPIVDVMRDEIVGYEALTRFADGVAPDVRFAEAVSVGLGEHLELATLTAALQAATSLPAHAWLDVNTSPQLVVRNDQLGPLIMAADRDIVLEVTEHAAIADYTAFRAAVERLGPRVRVAVDDAGAGFASLRHILELKPAFVKLDRGLIGGIDTDDARRALVAGLRHFTGATGMRLIAEGVETKTELAALRELDVHLAQGYLLGRPERLGRAIPAPARVKRVGLARSGRHYRASEEAPIH